MKRFACFVLTYLSALACLLAQELTTVTEACPAEVVQFNTPTPLPAGATQYDWDFCTGDLLQPAQGSLVTSFMEDLNTTGNDFHRPEGFDIAYDNGNWYGIVASRTNYKLFKADFGNSLDNLPTYKEIQSANGFVAAPRGVKIVKDNNQWFVFVSNVDGFKAITKFDFGSSLSNNMPVPNLIDLTGVAVSPQGINVIKENNKFYVVLPNFINSPNRKRVTILDFGTTITNTFAVVSATVSPFLGSHGKISMIKSGTNWYGFLAGNAGSNNLILANFGNSITNTPTFSSLESLLPSGAPIFSVEAVRDGNNYIVLVLSSSGEIFRMNYGNSISNVPTVTNLTNFGVMGALQMSNRPSLSSCLIKHESQYYFFSISRHPDLNVVNPLTPQNINILTKVKFPNICNATPSYSNIANPMVTYSESGTFYPNLTLKDVNENPVETYADGLLIKEAIIASFSYNNLCVGEPIALDNISRGAESNLLSWEWSFGDGQTSNLKFPTHTYTQAGKYEVKLKVNNMSGCSNQIIDTIRISSRPKADFVVKNIDCSGKAVTLEDLSNMNELDKSKGGFIKNRVWLFGDGTRWIASPFDATTYTKIYNSLGIFNVTLIVTDEVGCSSSVTKQISLLADNTPTANFNFTNACTDIPITFTDISTLPANSIGEINSWQWTFYNTNGVSIMAISTLKNPAFTYLQTGIYQVKLNVRNSLGCNHEVIKNIQVKSSINSQFSASSLTGSAPLRIQFTNLTTNATTYQWHFGNGEYSTQASPTYTFKENGVYVVSFQAKSLENCGKIATQTIIVESPTAQEDLLGKDVLKVYPNPSNKNIFIELPIYFKLTDAYITDMVGKVIQRLNLKTDKNQVDLAHLPKGVYILHVIENKNIWTKKIIKI